jgi:hypothetical protein
LQIELLRVADPRSVKILFIGGQEAESGIAETGHITSAAAALWRDEPGRPETRSSRREKAPSEIY